MQMEMTRKWELTIFMSDKKDFKTKAIKKDKKGHSIVTKRSTYEEDIILINKYTPNINDTNELIYKTETDSQTQKTNLQLPKGK